jgi:hypothetical protein
MVESDSPSRSGMGDTRVGVKSVCPLLLRRTVFGELDNVVDIAVNDIVGLSFRTFTNEGRVITWQIDNECRQLVQCIARSCRMLGQCELDMDNDVIMADAEDGNNWFVP